MKRLTSRPFLYLSLGATLMLLGGCSANPPVALERARASFARAQQDPQISANAPVPLNEAEQSLRRAEDNWNKEGDADELEHLAYLTEQRTEIARAVAQRRMAETESQRLAQERDRVLLESRTREAERARQLAELRAREAEQARQGEQAQARAAESARQLAEKRAQEAELARPQAIKRADELELANSRPKLPPVESRNWKHNWRNSRPNEQIVVWS